MGSLSDVPRTRVVRFDDMNAGELRRKLHAAVAAGVCAILLATFLAGSAFAQSDKVQELVARGESLLAEQEFEEARRVFRKAFRRSQKSSFPAAIGVARAELGIHRTDLAVESAKRAAQIGANAQDLAVAHNVLGMAHFRHGLVQGLVEREGEELVPSNAAREAEAAFRKVLELVGERAAPAHYSLAELLYAEKRIEEARTELDLYLTAAGPSASPQAMELSECLKDAAELDSQAENVTLPKAVRTHNPEYTEMARGARLEGTVIAVVIIDENGKVLCPRAIKGLPYGLTEATLAALRSWQFDPATVDGRPIRARYTLTTTFNLN